MGILFVWVSFVRPIKSTDWERVEHCPDGESHQPATGVLTFEGTGLAENGFWRRALYSRCAVYELKISTKSLLLTLRPRKYFAYPVPGPYLLHKHEVDCVCVRPVLQKGVRLVHNVEGFRKFLVFIPKPDDFDKVVGALVRRGYRTWTVR